MLTQQRLMSLVSYDPETGVFMRFGRRAGALHKFGYRQIMLDGRSYKEHRVAWLYVHGRWPSQQIDHINHVRDDNRIANLREASVAQNLANSIVRSDNKSGLKGVRYDRRCKRYCARIFENGKFRHIGCYKTAEEANAAYFAAARERYGDFACAG